MAADLILGIDPGLNGALALLPMVGPAVVAELYDMPVLTLKRRELDAYRLAHIIDNHAHEIAEVWLERVWSRPGEGAVHGFEFGQTYGLIKGICCASFLPVHEVPPVVWKRAMGVKGEKDEGRKAASILFPSQADQWSLVKHHGRADAVLIGVYGARQFQKQAA